MRKEKQRYKRSRTRKRRCVLEKMNPRLTMDLHVNPVQDLHPVTKAFGLRGWHFHAKSCRTPWRDL